MQKRKERNKSHLLEVGSFLILVGISVLCFKSIGSYLNNENEKDLIKDYYEEESIVDVPIVEEEIIQEKHEQKVEEKAKQNKVKVNYIAVLKIPKLDLEKGLASKGSYYNNVSRNIQILDESDMPDIEKGNVILAGHSGSSSISYFKNLNKLTIDDKVIISYKGKDYIYKMVNSYEIEKNGYAHIIRNAEKNTLTMITCKHKTNKQLVIICELVEER